MTFATIIDAFINRLPCRALLIVLFNAALPGGPGGGTDASNRRFFDPSFYRIILMDQRGAGKSTPAACLEVRRGC
jgi:hypothetical protein